MSGTERENGNGGCGPAIGIDLGTTYSCAAVWMHGCAEVIINGQGNRVTPSCVAFAGDEELVGDTATNQAARNPANTIYDAKRLIGRRFSDPDVQNDIKLWPFKVVTDDEDMPMFVITYKGEEKRLTAEDMSATILTYMREICEAQLGMTLTNVVITVPAHFNQSQRRATIDAGARAGLNVMQVISEPTAAAIAYGLGKSTNVREGSERNVLVFDLGGGTFDVTILKMGYDGVLKVTATSGDSHLGGIDFDNCLMQHCVEVFKRKHGLDVLSNPRSLQRLKKTCERAKRELSCTVETTIEVESLYEGVDFHCTITVAKFEELNIDLFKRCMSLVQSCLRDADMDKSKIDDVVLVGGSTRIPKVQELLKDYFTESKLRKDINPDEAVACGAAIHAAGLGGDESQTVHNFLISEVTPLSLGLNSLGGLMKVLIPRNTPIPARARYLFTTSFDNQTTIEFEIFEGERAMARDNHLLETFELTGIPKAPTAIPRIVLCFQVDENGRLMVTAEDESTKEKTYIAISNDLMKKSREMVLRMVEDAERHKADDEAKKKRVEARMMLETCAYDFRNAIKSLCGQNSSSSVCAMLALKLEQIVKDALTWVSIYTDASEEDFIMKKNELELKWKSAISEALVNRRRQPVKPSTKTTSLNKESKQRKD